MTYSDGQNEKPLITHSSYGTDDPDKNGVRRLLLWFRKRNTLVTRTIGIIGALATAYFLVSGIICLVQNSTEKDEIGYFPTWKFSVENPSFAVTFPSEGSWIPVNNLGSLKIQVTAKDPAQELFIGVADTGDIELYLGDTDHFTVQKLLILPDRARYQEHAGDSIPIPPDEEKFWTQRSSGTGTGEITWHPYSGNTLVIMNADGSTGIDTKITLWTVTAYKFLSGIGMLTAAFILGLLSSFIILSTKKSTNTVYPVPKMMLPKK